MKGYAEALERLLHESGCKHVRSGKGGHAIWFSPASQRHFPVAAKIKSRHTANEILKQAELPKAI